VLEGKLDEVRDGVREFEGRGDLVARTVKVDRGDAVRVLEGKGVTVTKTVAEDEGDKVREGGSV